MTEADHVSVGFVETRPVDEIFQTASRIVFAARNSSEFSKPISAAAPSCRIHIEVVDAIFAAANRDDQDRRVGCFDTVHAFQIKETELLATQVTVAKIIARIEKD
jgi:hypothetical protein